MMHKILFAGPVGAGKTTAIASVSDTPVVHTDVNATDEVLERKARTTVAMDYGTLRIDDSLTIQLVGTPGQERFSFMWDILSMGAIGVIVMIDNARPEPLSDLDVYLGAFRRLLDQNGGAGVVCVTRFDISCTPSIELHERRVRELGYRLPVFELDARRRADVKTALLAMASELNPNAHRRRIA